MTDHPLGADETGFRARVRALIERGLPEGFQGVGSVDDPVAFLESWRRKLADERLLAVAWPTRYGGGGMGSLESVIVAEERARVGLRRLSPCDSSGIEMLGHTLLRHGTDEQKDFFLPRIITGEHRWCQGYSEPGAGSDLAAVSCAARLDGDEWVVNGIKTWNSAAHAANWIFVLCRTEPGRGHRGLSLLLCPLDQAGITIRRIRMLDARMACSEVVFDDARTRAGHVVGPPGEGWPVAMTLLGFERAEAAVAQAVEFRAELDRLIGLVGERGLRSDPRTRDRLAWCHTRVEVMRYLGLRLMADLHQGRSVGAESSILKLFWSEYHTIVADLALEVLGAEATAPSGRWPWPTFGPDEPAADGGSASWVGTFFNARAGTVYSGTSEIQRDVIAERVLGLPRPPC